MKKSISKILCVFLSTCIINISFGNIYAQDTTLNDLSNQNPNIKIISDNQINVIDENGLSKITILKETPYTKEVLIEESSGDKIVLTTNKITNTLHSSKTNETLNIKDLSSNITFYASPSYGDIKVDRISFAKIKSSIGTVSSIATVIGFIVSFISGGTAALIGSLMTKLGGVTWLLNKINSGSSNHGFKITKKFIKRTVNKQGGKFTYGEWAITDISIY